MRRSSAPPYRTNPGSRRCYLSPVPPALPRPGAKALSILRTSCFAPQSEVRLFGLRDGTNVVTVEVLVVFGAAIFFDRPTSGSLPLLDGSPWHGEGAWVFDANGVLQGLAAIHQLEPLNHVQFVRVRSAVIIDKGTIIESDGIDDQIIAYVMPHRFASP